MELFKARDRTAPLAWRVQPETFDDVLGQSHLLGQNMPLRRLIEEDKIVSLILYGPPGTGKTAVAHIIAKRTSAQFISLNAVTSGIKDIRDAVLASRSGRSILFIDEIHRFNRVQQDALLPHVETGDIIIIGASTQNPFFSLVPALSSRSMIFQFRPLTVDSLKEVIRRAMKDPRGLGSYLLTISSEALDLIASLAEGDARRALNILELAFLSFHVSGNEPMIIAGDHIKDATQNKSLYYDENDHYNTISAFIKSMRGSDPDATVYWLAKMIASGEDPLFIARRIVICASEDVGNADPTALILAMATLESVEKIGLPECRIPLSQAALYVAAAPKSNAAYRAIDEATVHIQNEPVQEVPNHLKDSHYAGADRLGSGKGYLYPHNFKNHYVKQVYMTRHKTFYVPSSEGYERIIKSRLQKRRTRPDD